MSTKIIYIIVGVIWVVSQIIKAKNKSAQKAAPQKQPKPEPAFETVERKRTYPTSYEAQSYENASQEEIINEAEGDTEIMYQQPQQHLSAAQSYFHKPEPTPVEDIVTQEESLMDNFDPKKAIIYTELFSKPKWKE